MHDKEIKCSGPMPGVTCPEGATFVFSVGEQKFYQKNAYPEPKRCLKCRNAKHKALDAKEHAKVIARIRSGEKVTLQ